MKISVAMATYNGEKYLKEQLESIINQINCEDEIIICDDGSNDKTIEIIEMYSNRDDRIKLYRNSRLGVVSNFEFAISKCNNEIIMLCDQDDIWESDKVKKIKNVFNNTNSKLILHNGKNFSEQEDLNILIPYMKHGVIQNIFKSCYWGCCMAFKKELVGEIIPFPKNIVAHDQWIGLIAESRKEAKFLNESLIKHRIHKNNVSKKGTLIKKLKFRLNILFNYFFYKIRINKNS